MFGPGLRIRYGSLRSDPDSFFFLLYGRILIRGFFLHGRIRILGFFFTVGSGFVFFFFTVGSGYGFFFLEGRINSTCIRNHVKNNLNYIGSGFFMKVGS